LRKRDLGRSVGIATPSEEQVKRQNAKVKRQNAKVKRQSRSQKLRTSQSAKRKSQKAKRKRQSRSQKLRTSQKAKRKSQKAKPQPKAENKSKGKTQKSKGKAAADIPFLSPKAKPLSFRAQRGIPPWVFVKERTRARFLAALGMTPHGNDPKESSLGFHFCDLRFAF
jgi:hypothetical protein